MVRSYLVDSVDRLARELSEHAAQAQNLLEYRKRALASLAGALRFEAALFHELSPRAPFERAALIGIAPETIAASAGSWDENAVLFARLRDLALAQRGVASDADAFPHGSRRRAAWEERVNRAFGVRHTLAAHLLLGERIVSVVLLFRQRGLAFPQREQEALRALCPTLAVGDALHQALLAPGQLGVATQLRCRDQRLTQRQREIVERVALGHTNAQIAAALGTSANTVRNQLSDASRRLGAANRAEIVRVAVLR
jgi:DNA-binding CsgD family transcriptional regulator